MCATLKSYGHVPPSLSKPSDRLKAYRITLCDRWKANTMFTVFLKKMCAYKFGEIFKVTPTLKKKRNTLNKIFVYSPPVVLVKYWPGFGTATIDFWTVRQIHLAVNILSTCLLPKTFWLHVSNAWHLANVQVTTPPPIHPYPHQTSCVRLNHLLLQIKLFYKLIHLASIIRK